MPRRNRNKTRRPQTPKPKMYYVERAEKVAGFCATTPEDAGIYYAVNVRAIREDRWRDTMIPGEGVRA